MTIINIIIQNWACCALNLSGEIHLHYIIKAVWNEISDAVSGELMWVNICLRYGGMGGIVLLKRLNALKWSGRIFLFIWLQFVNMAWHIIVYESIEKFSWIWPCIFLAAIWISNGPLIQTLEIYSILSKFFLFKGKEEVNTLPWHQMEQHLPPHSVLK